MRTDDKISVAVFSILAVICFYASIFNGWYLLFSAMCAVMVWAFVSESRKQRNNQNK